MSEENLRYAHDEGFTDICYSSDGEKILTCGSDGDVRIWPKDEREDPIHVCIGEYAVSIRHKSNKIYVSTSKNDIQILSYPDGDREGVLVRNPNQINQIAVAKNTEIIALAAEDFHAKLINLNQPSDVKQFMCDSETCLSVALNPDGSTLAAGFGDGRLRIWNTENSELLKEICCFPRVNSLGNAKVLCRVDFEPTSGQYLAYPHDQKVVILKCDDWSEYTTLELDKIKSPLSIVQFSPCGKLMLAISIEGDFIIWNIQSQTLVYFDKHPNNTSICGAMWDPQGSGKIAFTDITGQFGFKLCTSNNDINIDVDDQERLATEEPPLGSKYDFDDIQFEDNDEDNENAISIERLKKEYLKDSNSEFDQKSDIILTRASTPRPCTPVVPLQAPFMPSSTPEHLDPRYLCWNEVGIVRYYGPASECDTNIKYIEVEFHDSTFHNTMSLQNYHNYSMGSLSRTTLVVANSSQITAIPLSSSAREWNLKVEEPDEIILIASSDNLLCFALSNYQVHVVSCYGTQRAVISIPGPLVSITAHQQSILVAYHASGVRNNDQCINIRLIRFNGMNFDSVNINSALSPESTLLWLGFSDVGTPAMMDSLGILCLYPLQCNTWLPFCKTTKHTKSISNGFFVTAVSESSQVVIGIKCRGSNYPGFTPRPTLCELPLEPLFAEDTLEKTQMEMNLFTWASLQVSDTEKKFKQTALKLFALACQNHLDQRALEFMEIISDSQLITLGIRYASKLEKRQLSEKLLNLAATLNDATEASSLTFRQNITSNLSEQSEIKPLNQAKLLKSLRQKHKSQKINTNESVKKNIENSLPETQETSLNTPVSEDLPSSSRKSIEVDSQSNSYSKKNHSHVDLEQNNFSDNISSVSYSDEIADIQEKNRELNKVTPKKINPFVAKSNEKLDNIPNPLSLTDAYAGFEYTQDTKINPKKNEPISKKSEVSEKRKKPASESQNGQPKEKQRRLDKFMFTKSNN